MNSVDPRLAQVNPKKEAPRVSMTPRRVSKSFPLQMGQLNVAGAGTALTSSWP
jgi:hypothetical protein